MSFTETIKKNRDLFIKFNTLKYDRFQQLMPNQNVKRVINSIPLLLSLNEKKLPGYIDNPVPVGISGYIPDKETIKYIQLRFHNNKIDLNEEYPAIEMLAVMGSVGTIAYTKKSDFDYWVCIDKQRFTQEALSAFNKKIELIQKWVNDEIKLEVHLFVNDIDSIKNSIFAEDDEEAFGSTIGAVLKDEFFRSSIIVAGKIPFWWVIPKFISDSEYNRLHSRLPEEYKRQWFVDLGNLFEISREDFLGAALFQLIKSLGNPFKSIIKIGVLEKYLFGPEDSPLLSQKVKQSILRGIYDNSILDSYILMFEEVYDHYQDYLEDKSLLKILRQNLYLKIDPQLSKYIGMKTLSNLPYKVVVLFKYVKEWKWSIAEIRDLDDFDNWDYNKIITFWNQVKKFMLLSYQNISTQLPTMNLANKISDSDFKLLTRKIKTHFSSHPEKIDNYITFKDTPHESILYFEPNNITIDTYEWRLLKRNTTNDDVFVSTVIQTDTNLLKLLAWASINQIFDPVFTRIKVLSGYQRSLQNHILQILSGLSNLFSSESIIKKNEYFLNESFTLVNMVVLNFNIENAESIKTIHHIYQSSWGESYIKEYSSDQDLVKIIYTILKDGLKRKIDFDKYCIIVSPEPHKKMYREIEKLFKELYEIFTKDNSSSVLRAVSKIGSLFFSVSAEKPEFTLTTSPSWVRLLSYISIKPFKSMSYYFIGDDPGISVIKSAHSLIKPKSITILYEQKGRFLFIYAINETGNFFSFIKDGTNSEVILLSFFHFIKKIINSINLQSEYSKINEKVFYYKISTDRFGKSSFSEETKLVEKNYLLKYDTKAHLSADISKLASGTIVYSLHSSRDKAIEFYPLNEIPSQISVFKKKNPGLSEWIIDSITAGDGISDFQKSGTTFYLMEKFKLEYILDKSKG